MQYVFLIGNIVLLIGTLSLIKTVLKNNESLLGYSTQGSLFTLLGVVIMQVGITQSSGWLETIPAYPIIAYWALVCYYKIKTWPQSTNE